MTKTALFVATAAAMAYMPLAAFADTPIALGGSDVTGAHALSMHGHVFDASPFQAERVETGVLTDRVTRHTMRVVKFRDGHMMALVSMKDMLARHGRDRRHAR